MVLHLNVARQGDVPASQRYLTIFFDKVQFDYLMKLFSGFLKHQT